MVTAPVSTLIRKFCPVFEMTRNRSGTGLKSTPKAVPESGELRVESNVAAPVAEFKATSRL